jgi:hypothetical protein
MGRADTDPTNRLTPEDIDACISLHSRVNPGGTLPDFGRPNQTTWVIRDEETHVVVGYLHLEQLVEIRGMVMDPEYAHKKMALTINYEAMEIFLKAMGHTHYYITVPKEHEHVQRFYEDKPQSSRVDQRSIRYRKELL